MFLGFQVIFKNCFLDIKLEDLYTWIISYLRSGGERGEF